MREEEGEAPLRLRAYLQHGCCLFGPIHNMVAVYLAPTAKGK
jgi:hypothetical protein